MVCLFGFLCESSKEFDVWEFGMVRYENDLWKPDFDLSDFWIDRTPEEYRAAMLTYSNIYEIPIKYVYGIISVESNWNVNAIHWNKNLTVDCGLVQMNSQYWNYYKNLFFDGREFSPFNPDNAIEFCFAYLDWLRDCFGGDINKAIMAYNVGPGAVEKGRRLDIGNQYLEKVEKRVYFFN